MAHTVNYNSETRIIEAKVQGNIFLKEMIEIYSEVMQIASKIATKKETFLFLSDFREATVSLSTLEIYDLPKTLSDITISFGLKPNQIKRAIVVKKASTDFYFAENVHVNRGLDAKFFYNVDEAKRWLSEK